MPVQWNSKATTSVEVSGEQHLFLGQRVLAAAYNIREAFDEGEWNLVRCCRRALHTVDDTR